MNGDGEREGNFRSAMLDVELETIKDFVLWYRAIPRRGGSSLVSSSVSIMSEEFASILQSRHRPFNGHFHALLHSVFEQRFCGEAMAGSFETCGIIVRKMVVAPVAFLVEFSVMGPVMTAMRRAYLCYEVFVPSQFLDGVLAYYGEGDKLWRRRYGAKGWLIV